MFVSKSKCRSVEAFGFDGEVMVDVRIGRRYGMRGTYVRVCWVRCNSERAIWKWKGNERELRINL